MYIDELTFRLNDLMIIILKKCLEAKWLWLCHLFLLCSHGHSKWDNTTGNDLIYYIFYSCGFHLTRLHSPMNSYRICYHKIPILNSKVNVVKQLTFCSLKWWNQTINIIYINIFVYLSFICEFFFYRLINNILHNISTWTRIIISYKDI